jgi:hypothetical protein
LFFLGNRTYVQGPTVFKYAFRKVQEDLGLASAADLFVKRFKQMAEVNTPIEVLPDRQRPGGGPAAATLLVTAAGRGLTNTVFTRPGSLPRVANIGYRFMDYREEGLQGALAALPYCEDFWDIVAEAVQVTKRFHLNKYNGEERKYKFVVGGFEKLHYVEPASQEPLIITCTIITQALIKGNIYNTTLLHVKGAAMEFSFYLPFIGKSITQ